MAVKEPLSYSYSLPPKLVVRKEVVKNEVYAAEKLKEAVSKEEENEPRGR